MRTWTPVGGLRVHAALRRPAGAGAEPVVLLHGLGVSSASLGPLAERLAARRLTACPDLPGFGRTASPAVWTTAEIVAALGRWMELRGLCRVVLAGHSYGCQVATELALRRPGAVAALVLLSPAFARRSRSPLSQAARLLLDAPMERPSLLAGGARDFLRAGPRRLVATVREAAAIPLEELVGGIAAPLLLVRGGRDPLTTRRWAAELVRRAPRAAVAEVPGAAHGLGHEAPRAVAQAVERFLAGALPSARGRGGGAA